MHRNRAGVTLSAKDELTRVLCAVKRPKLMTAFLSEIHTPAELKDMVLRWRLLRLLKAGRTQREVSKELGISLCKITRGSKILKNSRSAVNKILEAYNND